MTEAAVQLAIALELLSLGSSSEVSVHPDGMHARGFDIPAWTLAAGFEMEKRMGSTDYGGVYRRGSQTIIVNPKSGVGDVVGEIVGRCAIVECKGGIINTTHAGQVSRLRRGICEAVGLLMAREHDGAVEIVAVPETPTTRTMAERMRVRCVKAEIGFALVRRDGSVEWLQ